MREDQLSRSPTLESFILLGFLLVLVAQGLNPAIFRISRVSLDSINRPVNTKKDTKFWRRIYGYFRKATDPCQTHQYFETEGINGEGEKISSDGINEAQELEGKKSRNGINVVEPAEAQGFNSPINVDSLQQKISDMAVGKEKKYVHMDDMWLKSNKSLESLGPVGHVGSPRSPTTLKGKNPMHELGGGNIKPSRGNREIKGNTMVTWKRRARAG